jgi:hypothetical protein
MWAFNAPGADSALGGRLFRRTLLVRCNRHRGRARIGLTLGDRHDRQTDSNDTPFPYGHGYVNGGKWRDIMSYSESCSGCLRIPNWSNPRVFYKGEPTGTPRRRQRTRHPGAGRTRVQLQVGAALIASLSDPVSDKARRDRRALLVRRARPRRFFLGCNCSSTRLSDWQTAGVVGTQRLRADGEAALI